MNNFYINNTETPYIINQLYAGLAQLFRDFRTEVSDMGETKKSDCIKEDMIILYNYIDTIVNNSNTGWVDTATFQNIINQAYSLVSLKKYLGPITGGLSNSI